MNFQFYLEKALESDEFKEFKKQNPDCIPVSGFISIDKKGKDNKQHIDFFSPKQKKVFSFRIEEMKIHPLEIPEKYTPDELKINKEIDFNKIEELIAERMQKEKINKKIEKLIFSIQQKQGRTLLIGTIFISGLGLIKINIYPDKNEITEFEKKSFFDMMKLIRK